MAKITTLFIDKRGVRVDIRSPRVIDTRTDAANAVVGDDSARAIGWAGEGGLRGVVVRRQAGERFEDSVLRAFDEVNALL